MQTFSNIEQRINLAAIAKLSNADADFGGGVLVSGIFNSVPVLSYDVQSNNPRFECLEASISTVSVGVPVTIRTVSYSIQNIEFNGAGMAVLDLARA